MRSRAASEACTHTPPGWAQACGPEYREENGLK